MGAAQSPMIKTGVAAAEKIFDDRPTAKAVMNMQEYDPEFDLEDLTIEVRELCRDFFCNYFSGNMDYIDKVMGGTAHSLCKAMIELRKKEGWRYKLEELIDMRRVDFRHGRLSEGRPMFTY